MGPFLYGHTGEWHCGASGLHRQRGHDRVPLADGLESSGIQTGTAEFAADGKRCGEVWRRGGKGRVLCALRSEGKPVVEPGGKSHSFAESANERGTLPLGN